jgi:hypothetical protein
LLCWAVGVSIVLLFGSCSHRTYESVVTDTVLIQRTDSVIVQMREVDVELPVPRITLQERIPLCDTLLVLDNGLYASEVEIRDGQLTHTLKPSASGDTAVHGRVTVADTTRVHQDSVTARHRSTEREQVVTPAVETLWTQFKRSAAWFCAGVVATLVCLLVIRVVRRRLPVP